MPGAPPAGESVPRVLPRLHRPSGGRRLAGEVDSLATPIEEQIHRHFIEVERKHCAELQAAWDAAAEKKGKRPQPRDVPKPWKRPGPRALCQDPEMLAAVREFDYDLTDAGFQEYCASRARLSIAGVRESRRWEYFRDHWRGKQEFLADPYFGFAEEYEGKRYEYTPAEMQTHWRVLALGRAAFQDAWELYVAERDAHGAGAR
jgi:hypothetical protein